MAHGPHIVSIMTKSPACVHHDLPVSAVTALLVERGVSGVPVVDEHGRPIGVISKSDLVEHTHAKGLRDATVGDIMMSVAFTVNEQSPIGMAAAMMATEGVHRLPVVDSHGRVVGIVSTLDIVRWYAQRAGYPV